MNIHYGYYNLWKIWIYIENIVVLIVHFFCFFRLIRWWKQESYFYYRMNVSQVVWINEKSDGSKQCIWMGIFIDLPNAWLFFLLSMLEFHSECLLLTKEKYFQVQASWRQWLGRKAGRIHTICPRVSDSCSLYWKERNFSNCWARKSRVIGELDRVRRLQQLIYSIFFLFFTWKAIRVGFERLNYLEGIY